MAAQIPGHLFYPLEPKHGKAGVTCLCTTPYLNIENVMLYIMFYYCCPHESKVEILEEKIKEMNKQINNIYEILETLTNESKTKYLNESNNVQQVSI